MRWNSADIRRKPAAGRNPKGYGLPSLVIVMFFVSVLVSTIVNEMIRADEQARAEANFNVARDQMTVFGMTNAEPEDLDNYLPHMIAPPDGDLATGTDEDGPWIRFMTGTLNNREAVLYNDRMRGYQSRVRGDSNTTGLRRLNRGDIPRQHPERVLRSGDRMGTDLLMDGTSGPQDILAAGTITTGTGSVIDTEDGIETPLTNGVNSTLLVVNETARFNQLGARTLAGTGLEVSGDLTGPGGSGSAMASLIAEDLESDEATVRRSLTVDGPGQLADTDVTAITMAGAPGSNQPGSFLPDDFSNIDDIDFGDLAVNGLRVGTLRTETLEDASAPIDVETSDVPEPRRPGSGSP